MPPAPEQRRPGGDRVDKHLVDRGLARSRGHARELIATGCVSVAGQPVTKASLLVPPGVDVTVVEDAAGRWVGRGALKLLHALELWGGRGLRVTGRRCLDVGASTGGFTQVLLEHGAGHVVALDVGREQLVRELAEDPRVTDLPGTNIREVAGRSITALARPFDLVVGDLSFISLRLVLPHLLPLLAAEGDLVLLVKPQFEAGRTAVSTGQGVVRHAAARRRAVTDVVNAADGLGLAVRDMAKSGLSGSRGNTEYLLWLARRAPGMMSAGDWTGRIRAMTEEERR